MEFHHPSWGYSTNIYEVNIRQYSSEGTFKAFEKHLPRLKDMGVEVLWFMPVTPISKKDRKGTLGSYYAVQNYTAVNPEFGSLNDFVDLVNAAHKLQFKVIIDWVANHAGGDNVWVEEHPDFFYYDSNGNIVHPDGWEDVVKLNHQNEKMQEAMIAAMKFWIDTCDIDGFRCDMAHLVPLNFWRKARMELQKTKADLFWLAECEEPDFNQVFDATYTWKWMHKTEEFYKGHANIYDLFNVLKEYNDTFSPDAFRVYFTSNHDENSWNGTEYEKYGEAAKALAVFSCTWNGLPMIYSGQELPNTKRLKFFDKDVIEWTATYALHDFYKTLLHLRKRNKALRAGDNAVATYKIETDNDDKVFCFIRKNEGDEVLVILNLSSEKINCGVSSQEINGIFKNVFDQTILNFSVSKNILLLPWSYMVLEKQKAP